jgi:putative MFS transporter
LIKNKSTRMKYLNCILIGLPVWYIVGVLIALSQDVFAAELGIEGVVNGKVVMYCYIGLSVGDLLSGLISQFLKSRKMVVFIYLGMTLALLFYYIFATGYWAIFVTIAAEQFGTNIRSTVTNTVPNFVRGSVIPITTGFTALLSYTNSLNSALIVGLICIGLAAWGIRQLKESFSEDLDYFESM